MPPQLLKLIFYFSILTSFISLLLLNSELISTTFQSSTATTLDTSQDFRQDLKSFTINDFNLEKTCQYLFGQWNQSDSDDYGSLCSFTDNSFEYLRGIWLKTCSNITDPVKYAYDIPMDKISSQYPTSAFFPQYFSFGPLLRYNSTSTFKTLQDRSNVLQYSWIPTRCKLKPYNKQDLAKEIRKRRLYIVGDSLMMELADSLRYLSGIYDIQTFKTWTLLNTKTHFPASLYQWKFCSCLQSTTDIQKMSRKFTSNDFDSCWREEYAVDIDPDRWMNYCAYPPPLGDKYHAHESASMIGWVQDFLKFDTFIFSLGHHSYKLGKVASTYPQLVSNTIEWLENRVVQDRWNGTIIYVSTPMGHYQCWSAKEPLIEWRQSDIKKDYYGWLPLVNMQRKWLERAQESEILKDRFIYLDLSPMKLRPDGHYEGQKKDCLHWMVPGPVDTWSHFLFHVLSEINQK